MAVNSTRLRRKASNHLLLQRARIPLRKGWECVKKELYKITCTRNGETSDIGTYLLKPGPEAPMDCYRNFLNKTDVAVSIKSVPDGFIITDNSEPDTSYHLMFIPMDDDFWARCAAEKETK
jgi:hypothetical protein